MAGEIDPVRVVGDAIEDGRLWRQPREGALVA